MNPKEILVILNAFQEASDRLGLERDFYEEQLCNCSENNPYYKILDEKLSKIKTQLSDLEEVFTTIEKLVPIQNATNLKGNSIVSNDVTYTAIFEENRFSHIVVE